MTKKDRAGRKNTQMTKQEAEKIVEARHEPTIKNAIRDIKSAKLLFLQDSNGKFKSYITEEYLESQEKKLPDFMSSNRRDYFMNCYSNIFQQYVGIEDNHKVESELLGWELVIKMLNMIKPDCNWRLVEKTFWDTLIDIPHRPEFTKNLIMLITYLSTWGSDFLEKGLGDITGKSYLFPFIENEEKIKQKFESGTYTFDSTYEILILNECIDYMKKQHGDQTRKNGAPYFEHPLTVSILLKEKGFPIDYQIAGLFHDLLEDTKATSSDIIKRSSEEVFHTVKLLTKEPGYKTADYFERIKKNHMARMVKLADRIHNLSDAHLVSQKFQEKYIKETENWFLDLAKGTVFEEELLISLNNLKSY